jgi:hypothetical protein
MNENRVIVEGMEIPFGRMVAISFKWVFAALPAVLVAYFMVAWLFILISGSEAGVIVLEP